MLCAKLYIVALGCSGIVWVLLIIAFYKLLKNQKNKEYQNEQESLIENETDI